MVSVSAQVEIAAPPERVWQVLMDLERYRLWHPFVIMEGAVEEGAELAFTYKGRPGAPAWPTTVKVICLETHVRFSVGFGIRGIATMQQTFALQRISGGTRLTYGADFRGAVPAIAGPFVRKRLLSLHQVPLERLAQYIGKKNATGADKKEAAKPKPRKGFRNYRG